MECPVCGRGIYDSRGVGMYDAFLRNYCRALLALEFIASHEGLTAWEISQQSGIPYVDVSKGLQKARERQWGRTREEERDQGGKRYRYWSLEPERLVDIKAEHREEMGFPALSTKSTAP